jgi:hypothetical protein
VSGLAEISIAALGTYAPDARPGELNAACIAYTQQTHSAHLVQVACLSHITKSCIAALSYCQCLLLQCNACQLRPLRLCLWRELQGLKRGQRALQVLQGGCKQFLKRYTALMSTAIYYTV